VLSLLFAFDLETSHVTPRIIRKAVEQNRYPIVNELAFTSVLINHKF